MDRHVMRWASEPRERVADGVERQVIWGQNGNLSRFTFLQGRHVARHSHEAEQITCVMEGAMRVRLGDEDETVLRAGEALLIPPHVPHEVWMLEDTVVFDFFSPPRHDWKTGDSSYLTGRAETV